MFQLAICRYALINWLDIHRATSPYQWAFYQIRKKFWVTHTPGIPGTFSPQLRISDPDMHHGTCVTHVPWCMPGSLTKGILWGRWRGKRSRHSRRMRNKKFCASGKRPITTYLALYISPGLDGFNNASCIHSATNKTDTDQKPHTLYQHLIFYQQNICYLSNVRLVLPVVEGRLGRYFIPAADYLTKRICIWEWTE